MRKLILIGASLLCNSILIAQDNKLDTSNIKNLGEVTIVGNRANLIVGSGQYINQQKIQQLNQTNINNVIRIVPGVNVRDEEGFGLRPNIGLRGTPVNRSAKITVMEDGVLIAPAAYADPSAYYFPTFARIQGVEVLKGSSQIKYGPYTIGGAINLISTTIPESFKAFAQISYGSFNTNQQRIWVGDSKENFDYVFEANRIASNGFKELDNNGNTGFDRRDVMAKFRWHTNKNAKTPQHITLKLVNTSEDGNETYLGLTYDDYQKNALSRYAGTQKDVLNLNHQLISLSHHIVLSKGFYIQTTAYTTKTFRDWARASNFGGQSINNILNNPTANQNGYNIMVGKANGIIDYQSAGRTFNTLGIQSNFNYVFNTNNINHKLQIGFRWHKDEADRFATRHNYSMNNGIMILTAQGVKGNQENQLRTASSFAAHASYELGYKKLTINPGLRYEKIDLTLNNYGTADVERLGTALQKANNTIFVLLPGIGINYEINKSSNVFGGIHKGFSPPGMPSTSVNATQAKPEKSTSYELGYRYFNNSFNFHITGFVNNYQNILGSDNLSGGGLGTGDLFNAGKALIKGIELACSFDALQKKNYNNKIKLPISVAYTYTNATFRENFINGGGDWGSGAISKGDFIPFITPNLFTTTVGIETPNFNATVFVRFTGETRIKPGQNNKLSPQDGAGLAAINALEGFTIIDFSANYNLNKQATIFTSVNNLTNSKAIVANLPQGYRPNIPLSFQVGLKYSL
jgi:Fe(3+) dicitrate transport protein